MMIAAQIGQGGEQPRRQIGFRPQFLPLLMQPEEEFRDQVVGIGGVLHVAPGEREHPPLPSRDQAVQRQVIAVPQEGEIRAVVGRIVIHAERDAGFS